MEYTVSKKHRDAVAALTGDEKVKKALEFLKRIMSAASASR